MTTYRITPIPAKVAERVREKLAAPGYGHPAHVEVASGYGPCRSCLDVFAEGREERILFTYDPFHGIDPYPSPGPVFIHREDCQAWDGPGFPPGLRGLPLTFEGYGRDRWLVARERVHGEDVEGPLARVLGHPDVEYVHVRNTEAGCYIARVERVGGDLERKLDERGGSVGNGGGG